MFKSSRDRYRLHKYVYVYIPSILMLFSDDCSDTKSNIPRVWSLAFVVAAESVADGEKIQNNSFEKEY